MANSLQSKIRVRQAEKRRIRNVSKRSSVRTYIKRVIKCITTKNKDLALKEYTLVTSKIDKMVKDGIFHKNKGNRHKRRLNIHIKNI